MNMDSKQNNPWFILGAGSVGHLLACKFAQEQIPSVLLSRSEIPLSAAESVKEVQYQTEHSILYQLSYQASGDCNKINRLLLTVKAHQVITAIEEVKHALHEESEIFLLQNGMGITELVTELLAGIVNPTNIYPGTNTHGVYLDKNKNGLIRVNHVGVGAISFGGNFSIEHVINNPPSSENSCFKELQNLNLNIRWNEDIERVLWLKLAVNAAINPITAVNDCLNGELLKSRELQLQVEKLCHETSLLYAQMALEITESEIIESTFRVIKLTNENQSSMLQDLKSNKVTEIEHINGYLLKLSDNYDLDMNQHRHYYQQLKLETIL